VQRKRRREMTKEIRCKDVGVDCDFVATGETEEEIMKKAAEHAKKAHGMNEIPQELVQRVRAAIHTKK
jgi:predicted small metal-binding protein